MNKDSLNMEDVFTSKEDVVIRHLGGDMCLYSPSRGLIMTLNKTAAQIWESCDGKRKLEQIMEGSD